MVYRCNSDTIIEGYCRMNKKIEIINPNRYKQMIKKQTTVREEAINPEVAAKIIYKEEDLEKIKKLKSVQEIIQYKQDLLLKKDYSLVNKS